MKLQSVSWNKKSRKGVFRMNRDDFEFEVRHVGINCENEEEADAVAQRFEDVFGFTKKAGNSSIFAGTGVEVMKTNYLGKNGHIAVATNDIEKAKAYLAVQGIEFDEESAKYKNGKMVAIYLREEFGGFAVHLVQK